MRILILYRKDETFNFQQCSLFKNPFFVLHNADCKSFDNGERE